ncbi:PAS domain-containing sensor histidine kinase [Bacteroidota bacterium]
MLIYTSKKELIITPILCFIAIAYQIYSLFRHVEKGNRDLKSFLESIRFSDFSRTFQLEGLGSSFDNLKRQFNDVIMDFQKIRTEKEEHYHYLQNVIQHVGISILAYQKNGKIELINNAAKRLFKKNYINNIQELSQWSVELTEILKEIKPNENRLVKVEETDDILQLAIYATEFKISDKRISLVSIKNIQDELEANELDAWQKLIRVLTHEIMNSIAPIASLSSTVQSMVGEVKREFNEKMPESAPDNIEDIIGAIDTIHKRTSGLIHFVETYRNLTRIPKPNFSIFKIEDLIRNIHNVLREELMKKNIECNISINPTSLELTADEDLIEQVLINLLQNSMQALDKNKKGKIDIKAFYNDRGRKLIQVIDNGQGIIPEVGDKIFIPFFTTKSSGSGIGLALSRQIMRLHDGTITMSSEPDEETMFTLTF